MAFTRAEAQTVGWTMYSSADHVTPTVPTDLTVVVSKDGAGFVTPAGPAASVANGFCTLAGTAADWTCDVFALYATGTGVDPVLLVFYTEANYTPTRAGYLDAAITSRAAASVLTGITSLAAWLRAMLRKDTADADALTEINAGGGAYSEATDALEAIRDRGDAAWLTGNGTGSAHVHLLVKTDETPAVVVAGASVTVPGAGTQTTDALGSTGWNLDDGTYTVTIRSNGFYTPADSYTVVVSGGAIISPAGGILSVTPQTIAEPTNPNSCMCYLYMYHAKGVTALGASEGSMWVSDVLQRPTSSTVVYADDYNADAPAVTNAVGYVALELPRGMVCNITASWPDRGDRSAKVTVPDAATYNLASLFQDTVPAA
ncbi:MAG TPA: hypothetical protein PKY40_15550 [Burkholderiaceae bacterium]|nr:hypothetical protein [Burkholderiaceae bacterium]